MFPLLRFSSIASTSEAEPDPPPPINLPLDSRLKSMAPPAKRIEAGKPEKAERRFSSVAEISQTLRSQDEQGLLGGAVRHGFCDRRIPCSPWRMPALTGLRNQLTVKYNESTPPPDDDRIRLAREWMEASPGAKELFDLWTTINQVRNVYPLVLSPDLTDPRFLPSVRLRLMLWSHPCCPASSISSRSTILTNATASLS